jgi:hypothetical protein
MLHHHSSKCFSSAVLYFYPISLFNRRYYSLDICGILHISVFIIFSLLIVRSAPKSGSLGIIKKQPINIL